MRWRIFAVALAVLGLCNTAGRCATIGEVRAGSSRFTAMMVTVTGVVTYVDPQECYIEAADRSSGVLVQGDTTAVVLGSNVEAQGIYSIAGGEPAIVGATITPLVGTSEIRPFALKNGAISGAAPAPYPSACDYIKDSDAPGIWRRAAGANNTGLLVRTWGTVKACYQTPPSGTRWFCIDDGKAIVSDLGDTGVLVYSTKEVAEGDFVSVTGISSVEPSLDDSTRLIRVVRTRTTDDVQVERPKPVLQRPFSDEFGKLTLDPGWAVAADTSTGGSFSLNQEPGCLTLVAATSITVGSVYHRTQAIQAVIGDWDMEAKVRFSHQEGEGMNQYFSLVLASRIPFLWQTYSYAPDDFVFLAGASYAYPPGTEPPYRWALIGMNKQVKVPRGGDTCYFRASKRGLALTAYFSPDGSDYSVSGTSSIPSQTGYRYFVAYLGNGPSVFGQFSAAIDYIRFTPYTGGQ